MCGGGGGDWRSRYLTRVTYCEIDIGDEFHYLLCCPTFKEERKNVINSKYYRRPSTIYLYELFYQTKGENLKKLAMFVKLIICKF